MTNVAPRGLFGRSGAAWKPPANVWARVAGAWKQADYVWAFHNGGWQLIWARVPAPPPNALLSWIRPSMIHIAWSVPTINPNANWIVRRSDGSIVATVGPNTYNVDDTRPLLHSSSTANSSTTPTPSKVSMGSRRPAKAESSDVQLWNLTPRLVDLNTVAYPSASTSTVIAELDAERGSYGDPQGWQVYLDGYGFVGSVLPGSARTTSIAGQGRGVQQTWRIIPMTLSPAGAWTQAGNCNPTVSNNAAADPTGVTLTAVGLNNLRLSWNPPLGSITGWEIQYYVSSWQALGTVGSGVTAVRLGDRVDGLHARPSALCWWREQLGASRTRRFHHRHHRPAYLPSSSPSEHGTSLKPPTTSRGPPTTTHPATASPGCNTTSMTRAGRNRTSPIPLALPGAGSL